MNWFSAFAWCDAIGKQLIDLTQECNKATGTTACPQFTGVGVSNVWTRNVPDPSWAYKVLLSNGDVIGSSVQRESVFHRYNALCK